MRARLQVLIVEKDKIGAGVSTCNGGITSGNLRYFSHRNSAKNSA